MPLFHSMNEREEKVFSKEKTPEIIFFHQPCSLK
jgi:hypothetical protein